MYVKNPYQRIYAIHLGIEFAAASQHITDQMYIRYIPCNAMIKSTSLDTKLKLLYYIDYTL
jgi:hypothetical protein